MRFDARSVMLVLMVCVMDVAMFMLERIVNMHVLVPFGNMYPQSDTHQAGRNYQFWRQRVVQQQDGRRGADKRRKRKIGARSRRSQMTQREHEEDEAHADAEKTNDPRPGDIGQGRGRCPPLEGESDVNGT